MMKLATLALVVSVGCATTDTTNDPAVDQELSTADAAAVVALVDYPGTDATVLHAIGLDARAITKLVAARNGADGITPSDDDVPYTTLDQIDAVPYIGAAALTKLAAYATAHPAPAGEIVETVTFTGWQSEAVVWGVDHATQAELAGMIDSRAAAALVAKRPFTTVTQMGPISYVGAAALTKLRSHALGWWGAAHGAQNLAGRFDGAVFDEAEAETALAITNAATTTQLTGHKITGAAAAIIIANRPYTTLAQVSALSGIGSSTMNALLAYAQSGQWGTAPTSCMTTFTSAVTPNLTNLLFLSESDRPLDVIEFQGAGATAPTAASLVSLLGAPANSPTETRDPNNFLDNLEADDAAAAVIRAAYAAELTDVTYIAITPVSGNTSAVDVYLVGRTACGDLVGLHSISIET